MTGPGGAANDEPAPGAASAGAWRGDLGRPGLVVEQLRVPDVQPGQSWVPLDLTVAPGERILLDGPTDGVARVLAGIAGRGPCSGRVALDGAPVDATSPPGHVGYLSYEHRLIGTLTAAENVVTPMLAGRGRAGADVWRRAEQHLGALDLAPATWHNLVEQLSGGQQQRVALARALVDAPRLLVLDDPTSELDPDTAALVVGALDRAAAGGMCCVLSSTDPIVIESCHRRVLLIIDDRATPLTR